MRYIGFDVGGTKCAVTVANVENGTVAFEGKRAFATPTPWQEAVEQMFCAAEELLGGRRADACGFSCGSPLDAERGIILAPPNLPGWDHVPVTQLASERFGIPAFLENDANACALAEWRWGAGRGTKHMVFLTFGTGMGAGLILEGRLIRGANGNAGEVGHMRLSAFGPAGYGKEGSFEGFCSGGGVKQLGVTLGKRAVQSGVTPAYYGGDWEQVSAKSIAQAALAGDETAREVYRLCGEKLGEGLSVLVDVLNPERIVIGSIYARSGELLCGEMRRVMQRECLRQNLAVCEVVPAGLGESLGDYAALCVAEYGLGAR